MAHQQVLKLIISKTKKWHNFVLNHHCGSFQSLMGYSEYNVFLQFCIKHNKRQWHGGKEVLFNFLLISKTRLGWVNMKSLRANIINDMKEIIF